MPTNKQRIFGALASIGITVGGAWLASEAYTESESEPKAVFSEGISATFEGIRNATGNIVVMVFADRASFKIYDVEKAVGYKEVQAQPGTVKVAFPDLKTGPYAIAAFHDEDGNQDLNMNGEWPTEGYATSGAVDAYDTPTFRSATLRKSSVNITMHYAN